MSIAIWKTGHEIADRVAESLAKGIYDSELLHIPKDNDRFSEYAASIAYGILRGTSEIFKVSDRWFNVDRGYFSPSHYDGYYRISYRGTQAKYDADYAVPECQWGLESIRKYDHGKPVLVCPPTDAVCAFFGFDGCGINLPENKMIRKKGDTSPIPWDDISAVVTFNSSVGWQAVMKGIPCLSDTTHSVIGSYYNTKSLDEVIDMFHSKPREPMLDFMRAHQFTLAEIEKRQAWNLINHYITSSSATTAGKLSAPMSPPTVSGAGLRKNFQSAT